MTAAIDTSDPARITRHPDTLLEATRVLTFVCPLCRGGLDVADEAYRCMPCERTYPVHGGVPDFRVFPDPYLDYTADHRRTELVLAELDRRELPQLLELYWSHSDITPAHLKSRFIGNALRGEARARRVIRLLDGKTFREPVTAARVLEIGSGSGNFLVEAARRYPLVVGTDIGMRWLHISRRRFRDRGLPEPPLVCCCAEHLPFADGQFDLAVCASTLEFCRDIGLVLAEAARVLTAEGAFYLDTVNRYSLARNPYADLWGVGFLPRAWQPAYVRWRRQTPFEMIRMVSLLELRRHVRRVFRQVEIQLPDVDDEVLGQLPPLTRFQVRAYRGLKGWLPFRKLLQWIAPQWDVKLSHALATGGKR